MSKDVKPKTLEEDLEDLLAVLDKMDPSGVLAVRMDNLVRRARVFGQLEGSNRTQDSIRKRLDELAEEKPFAYKEYTSDVRLDHLCGLASDTKHFLWEHGVFMVADIAAYNRTAGLVANGMTHAMFDQLNAALAHNGYKRLDPKRQITAA